ncbi:MAG: N-6 DNA methylase [Nitrososphaerota archaeon]|nr:N-6 DNA methylase [Nitrososphaerota archaeon]
MSSTGRVHEEKSRGQYFTPNSVVDFMVGLISKSFEAKVLDPCAGRGAFVDGLIRAGFSNVSAIEEDPRLITESEHRDIRLGDFLFDSSLGPYDVIIGNPPYVRWKNILPTYKASLLAHPIWSKRLNSLADLLHPFLYQGVDQLAANGELIFIAPQFWMETIHAAKVRRHLSEEGHIEVMVHFGEARVFPGVASTISIFKFVKCPSEADMIVVDASQRSTVRETDLSLIRTVLDQMEGGASEVEISGIIGYRQHQFVGGGPWRSQQPTSRTRLQIIEANCYANAPMVTVTVRGHNRQVSLNSLMEREDLEVLGVPLDACTKLSSDRRIMYMLPSHASTLDTFNSLHGIAGVNNRIERYIRLGDIAAIGNGIVTGFDKAFWIGDPSEVPSNERGLLIPVVKARSVRRYFFADAPYYVFPNRFKSEQELSNDYPYLYAHLRKNKPTLEARYQYGGGIPWWHWIFLRNYALIAEAPEMIVTPCKERFNSRGYVRFAYVPQGYLVTQDVTAIVKKGLVREDLKYLLGWLLTRQVFYWLSHKGFARGGVQEFSEEPLRRIPMRLINWADPHEVELHDLIVHEVSESIHHQSDTPYHNHVQSYFDELCPLP